MGFLIEIPVQIYSFFLNYQRDRSAYEQLASHAIVAMAEPDEEEPQPESQAPAGTVTHAVYKDTYGYNHFFDAIPKGEKEIRLSNHFMRLKGIYVKKDEGKE